MKIHAHDIHKAYGDVTALDGLELEIPSGTTFGVLGTNGAGKTTLFRLLVGHDRPDSGRLMVGDRPVTEAGVEIRKRVGYLPERLGFPPGLTGREVLRFHARMRGLPNDGRIERTLDTVGLSLDAADRAVEGYSNGMCRRLGLAAALLPDPAVLVLDEPTAGLDPRGVSEFHDIVERVRERTGATVVLTSHVLPEVERLCDHVAVLHDGQVRTQGPVSELVAGTDTTVRVRPARAEDISAVVETGRAFGHVTTRDGTVSVTCDPGDVPDLFAAFDADLVDTTVDRAGLEATFQNALTEGTS